MPRSTDRTPSRKDAEARFPIKIDVGVPANSWYFLSDADAEAFRKRWG
jgi:hypothetical protein